MLLTKMIRSIKTFLKSRMMCSGINFVNASSKSAFAKFTSAEIVSKTPAEGAHVGYGGKLSSTLATHARGTPSTPSTLATSNTPATPAIPAASNTPATPAIPAASDTPATPAALARGTPSAFASDAPVTPSALARGTPSAFASDAPVTPSALARGTPSAFASDTPATPTTVPPPPPSPPPLSPPPPPPPALSPPPSPSLSTSSLSPSQSPSPSCDSCNSDNDDSVPHEPKLFEVNELVEAFWSGDGMFNGMWLQARVSAIIKQSTGGSKYIVEYTPGGKKVIHT